MVLKIARFVNLFLVALLAGLLVGVFIVELAPTPEPILPGYP